MPLSSGDKLGPYEVLAPIGTGGMGEVYKAAVPMGMLSDAIAPRALMTGCLSYVGTEGKR
jgi:hypothetical protein